MKSGCLLRLEGGSFLECFEGGLQVVSLWWIRWRFVEPPSGVHLGDFLGFGWGSVERNVEPVGGGRVCLDLFGAICGPLEEGNLISMI